ncbi:MAG: outer membrane beta-barrel protein, partial [Acetobacteraceae bacterium]
SRTDWTASAGGTISIGRDQLTLAAAHLLLHQDRTQIDALPTDQPVAYQVNDLRASYAMTLSRISLTPSVEATSYDYASTTIMGQPASQSYRNRVLVQGGVTASYQAAPSRNLLVVLRGLDSHYTQPQADAPSRDSTGWVALAGIDTKLDGLWRIRVLAGWEGREFASPQYGNHSAPVAEADIVFSPTGLTTITGTLARTIEDAAQEGVAGYVDTSGRLTIDHEYARNIMLQGYGSVQHAAYLQGGGSQTGYGLGGSVTWLLNRHIRVSATEDFTAMRGAAPGQSGSGSFNRNVTLLTIGFGL